MSSSDMKSFSFTLLCRNNTTKQRLSPYPCFSTPTVDYHNPLLAVYFHTLLMDMARNITNHLSILINLGMVAICTDR